jgi:hypothetical protein
MRRLLFSALALSWLGLLTGCHCITSHGVCDCDIDDHCASRQPWVAMGAAPALGTPVEYAPAPLPKGAPPVEQPKALPKVTTTEKDL